jgi:hypothetical protein
LKKSTRHRRNARLFEAAGGFNVRTAAPTSASLTRFEAWSLI